MLFYEKSINGNLHVHYTSVSAMGYVNFEKKIHTHTEYDTEWSNLLSDWKSKKYFRWYNINMFYGTEECIFRLDFIGVDLTEEFIKELNRHLNDYAEENENVHQI